MIVIGYSADPYGRVAIEHGVAEAKRRGTGVVVINATAGDAYVDPRFARAGEVDDVEDWLRDAGVEFEVRQSVGTDVVAELLEAMEDPDAELLVIGVRHRSPVGKLLLGSISQQLLLECPKPVLAVKPHRL